MFLQEPIINTGRSTDPATDPEVVQHISLSLLTPVNLPKGVQGFSAAPWPLTAPDDEGSGGTSELST